MDSNRVILLASSQHRGRERPMVGRIGKVLRLQTKSVALLIDFAVLSGERAVEKISCVELNSWLSRPDFHRASRSTFIDHSSLAQSSYPAIQHKVVIITFAKLQLLIVVIDALSD